MKKSGEDPTSITVEMCKAAASPVLSTSPSATATSADEIRNVVHVKAIDSSRDDPCIEEEISSNSKLMVIIDTDSLMPNKTPPNRANKYHTPTVLNKVCNILDKLFLNHEGQV
jgi:hypothetical protein